MADKVRFVDSSITISPGGNTGGGGGNNEGTLVIANPTYDGPNILNTIRVGTTLFKIEGSNNNTNGIFTDLNNSKSTTNDLQITGSLSISNPNPNILFDVGDSDFFTNPSNSNGKPKFFVTNNTTSYNAFLNGRLFLGQNGKQ